MGEQHTVNSEFTKAQFKKRVDELYEIKPFITFDWHFGRPRTPKQNNALHVFCDQIAERCNDAGYWYEIDSKVLRKTIQSRWTKERVKELMWRSIQNALYPDTTSTKDLNTVELIAVAEELSAYLAKHHEIHVKFPSKDEIDGNKARRSG